MTTQIKAGVIAANAITASELASSALSGGSFTGDVTFDTDTLVIDSSNNRVGIGQTTPVGTLHVKMGSAKNILFQDALSSAALKFVNDNSTAYVVGTINASTLILNADSGGNVGIGTTNPDRQLEIYGTEDGYLKFDGGRVDNHGYTLGSDNSGFVIYDDTIGSYRFVIDQDTGNVGIGTTNPSVKLDVSGNFAANNFVTSSSDPTQTTNPAGGVGTLWLNSTSGEAYVCTSATTDNNVWMNIGEGQDNIGFIATGGNTTGTFTDGGTTYKYHQFTTSGSFVVTGSGTVDILLVAGGGSGGGNLGGGGGAGGLLETTSQSLTAGTYTVTIGAGGAGVVGNQTAGTGNSGSNSTFIKSGTLSLTAVAGGYGNAGANQGTGGSGGSGGGSSGYGSAAGASGTSGQGNSGGAGGGGASNYPGGGGGGAGAAGQTPSTSNSAGGDGGNGLQKNYNGTNYYWAGGGGGGHYSYTGDGQLETGRGGEGGGGGGGGDQGTLGAAGTGINNGNQGQIGASSGFYGGSGGANTGGGGGSTGHSSTYFTSYTSGNGGSGICIVRYAI